MVGVEASWPPVRASDADRDDALRALRDAAVDGYLSDDTFMKRIEDALRIRDRAGLAALVMDLPSRPRIGDRLIRVVSAVSETTRGLQRAWHAPRLPLLVLPTNTGQVQSLGRSPDCDLVLDHPSVSRWHAQLRSTSSGWELRDVGSTNGTRVNGWRVGPPRVLRRGDFVTFGALTLLVSDGQGEPSRSAAPNSGKTRS